MPIPFKLDFVIDQLTKTWESDPRRNLRAFTGVRLSRTEAMVQWQRVAEHKWYVSERLGRDVGMHVAAVDYFENVYRPSRTPFRESAKHLFGQARAA